MVFPQALANFINGIKPVRVKVIYSSMTVTWSLIPSPEQGRTSPSQGRNRLLISTHLSLKQARGPPSKCSPITSPAIIAGSHAMLVIFLKPGHSSLAALEGLYLSGVG